MVNARRCSGVADCFETSVASSSFSAPLANFVDRPCRMAVSRRFVVELLSDDVPEFNRD